MMIDPEFHFVRVHFTNGKSDHEGNFHDVMCLVIAQVQKTLWVQMNNNPPNKVGGSAGLGIYAA